MTSVMERYLPVPVWNNTQGAWEPLDFRLGQRVAPWPVGFDPANLPLPEYRDGDRVQFVRDETCAREGRVRLVMLRGGAYAPFERTEEVIKSWYCDPAAIVYIVTARAHDHFIHTENILGRFITPASQLRASRD